MIRQTQSMVFDAGDVKYGVTCPIRMNEKVDLRAACVAFFVISVVPRRIHLLLCVRNHVRNHV